MILNVCVCMWKIVYAVATTLKGGVSSTAVFRKMASQSCAVEPQAGRSTVATTPRTDRPDPVRVPSKAH